MTRKCYACIMTAKEDMKEIQNLARNPVNICKIMSIATKFISDFGDVDPDWKPGDPMTQPKPQAVPVAPPAPKPAVNRSYAVDPRAAAPLF